MGEKKITVVKKKDRHKLIKADGVRVRGIKRDQQEFVVARGAGGYKRFKVQHPTFEDALKEAVRLADTHGGTYLVLPIVTKVYGRKASVDTGQNDTNESA